MCQLLQSQIHGRFAQFIPNTQLICWRGESKHDAHSAVLFEFKFAAVNCPNLLMISQVLPQTNRLDPTTNINGVMVYVFMQTNHIVV